MINQRCTPRSIASAMVGACIGRDISYFEHVLAVGTIVRLFDIELLIELVTLDYNGPHRRRLTRLPK